MDASLNWDNIVDSLGPKLYRYFCARFDDLVADDLTQETLVRLVTKFNDGDFDDSKGTIEMFAFGIARFVRLEELKRLPKIPATEMDESKIVDSSSTIEHFESASEIHLLRRGVASLSEPEQEIILLMIDKEWALQKISEHMEMPLGTVKSHVHRAKKNISSFINEKAGEYYGRL
jgi:RNA polymerase sigma factor (sigma-70 family)